MLIIINNFKNIYIHILLLSGHLFVCFYPLNVKRAELNGLKFHRTLKTLVQEEIQQKRLLQTKILIKLLKTKFCNFQKFKTDRLFYNFNLKPNLQLFLSNIYTLFSKLNLLATVSS